MDNERKFFTNQVVYKKDEKKKVVIYVRYSSQRQGEISVDKQLTECYRYCNANGFKVVKEYVDVSDSAKSDTRPQFTQMITDSNNREFEGVIVYQLDKFARNRYDNATYKSILKKNGVKVYSTRENFSDDPSGILMESVIEGMIEYFAKDDELLNKVLAMKEANLNNEQ